MNQSDIQSLTCTDQLRKENRLGLVVATQGETIKVHWDGDKHPTAYSKDEVGDLRSVVIERRADVIIRGGANRGFHTRVFRG
jgi:hypothetical protein